MSANVVGTILGGALVGMIALAMDYFFLQHLFKTPVSIAGGINAAVVLVYLVVPFLVLWLGGKRDRSSDGGRN